MDDFWELSFKRNTVMWGKEPADAAVMVANSFKVKGYDEILMPGCGYGRNALPFIAMAMNVIKSCMMVFFATRYCTF